MVIGAQRVFKSTMQDIIGINPVSLEDITCTTLMGYFGYFQNMWVVYM
jgi:hypothetical protein